MSGLHRRRYFGDLQTWKENDRGGFGFIKPAGGGPDLFVDLPELELGGIAEPRRGMRLEYELGEDQRGRPRAVRVAEA